MVGTVIAKVAGSSLGATYTMPAADGASGEFLKTDGSTNLSFASAAAGFNRQVVYTTSSSAGGYSPDTGVTKIIVEIVGAGGGGGRYTADGPKVNSGASGGYIRKTITVVSTDTMTVTIGGYGTAGGSNSSGSNGGDTTFVSVTGTSIPLLTAGGGGGGLITDYGGAVPGTATGGDFNIAGMQGKTLNFGTGDGGNTIYGHGGSRTASQSTTLYPNATGYGAGGGAASDTGIAGNGAPGLCIITEYK